MQLEPNGALEIGTDSALIQTAFKPSIIRSLMFINGSFSQSIYGEGYPNFVNVSGFNGVGRNPTNKGLVGRIDEYRQNLR
jgi:hypothetical protein